MFTNAWETAREEAKQEVCDACLRPLPATMTRAAHMAERCPEGKVMCPLECGATTVILRRTLQAHLDRECSMAAALRLSNDDRDDDAARQTKTKTKTATKTETKTETKTKTATKTETKTETKAGTEGAATDDEAETKAGTETEAPETEAEAETTTPTEAEAEAKSVTSREVVSEAEVERQRERALAFLRPPGPEDFMPGPDWTREDDAVGLRVFARGLAAESSASGPLTWAEAGAWSLYQEAYDKHRFVPALLRLAMGKLYGMGATEVSYLEAHQYLGAAVACRVPGAAFLAYTEDRSAHRIFSDMPRCDPDNILLGWMHSTKTDPVTSARRQRRFWLVLRLVLEERSARRSKTGESAAVRQARREIRALRPILQVHVAREWLVMSDNLGGAMPTVIELLEEPALQGNTDAVETICTYYGLQEDKEHLVLFYQSRLFKGTKAG